MIHIFSLALFESWFGHWLGIFHVLYTRMTSHLPCTFVTTGLAGYLVRIQLIFASRAYSILLEYAY